MLNTIGRIMEKKDAFWRNELDVFAVAKA